MSSSKPTLWQAGRDSRGSIGPEHIVLYFFAVLAGVTVLSGWALGTYDHARFTHDTLTLPYEGRANGVGGLPGISTDLGGTKDPGQAYQNPPTGWGSHGDSRPTPPPSPTDPTNRGGHLRAPQERSSTPNPGVESIPRK